MPDGPEAAAGDASAALVAAVREDSAAARLSTLSSLKARFPDADPAQLIGGSGAEDLKFIEGKRETYYFSELSITRPYALLL
ncbi:MAG: hypothetical protein Q8M76_08440, partial [Spirochaetaceae bacterium]|nr:hypothetical protein [Spirochaetaceae bacterium]